MSERPGAFRKTVHFGSTGSVAPLAFPARAGLSGRLSRALCPCILCYPLKCVIDQSDGIFTAVVSCLHFSLLLLALGTRVLELVVLERRRAAYS